MCEAIDIQEENIDFSDLLENISHRTHIEALKRDAFLDSSLFQSTVPESHAKAAWRYTMACHQLVKVESETRDLAQLATFDTLERVFELEKQKNALKALVEKEKVAYEAHFAE